MYKASKRTCLAIDVLINSFVLPRSRYCCYRACLRSQLSLQNGGEIEVTVMKKYENFTSLELRLLVIPFRFIISYFLSDDTILVFEPPQRNSGILGGKFLERGRIKKPDGVNYFIAQVSDLSYLDCFVNARCQQILISSPTPTCPLNSQLLHCLRCLHCFLINNRHRKLFGSITKIVRKPFGIFKSVCFVRLLTSKRQKLSRVPTEIFFDTAHVQRNEGRL